MLSEIHKLIDIPTTKM